MTVALVDDQLLSAVLRGRAPRILRDKQLFTTGCWYVRLCQAAHSKLDPPGSLSGPFADLPEPLRERAFASLFALPDDIGLLSLRDLGPRIGELRSRYRLNLLAAEALAAAIVLDARVYVKTMSTNDESAFRAEGIATKTVL